MRVCKKQALSRVKYYYHTTAKYSSTNNDCIKRIAILAGSLGKRDVPKIRTERHKEKQNTQHTTTTCTRRHARQRHSTVIDSTPVLLTPVHLHLKLARYNQRHKVTPMYLYGVDMCWKSVYSE